MNFGHLAKALLQSTSQYGEMDITTIKNDANNWADDLATSQNPTVQKLYKHYTAWYSKLAIALFIPLIVVWYKNWVYPPTIKDEDEDED